MTIPTAIQVALNFSRNFAESKPNIGPTEKEHILGLAKLLEQTAIDAGRYQWLRNDDNWGADDEPGLRSWGELGERAGDDFDEIIDERIEARQKRGKP